MSGELAKREESGGSVAKFESVDQMLKSASVQGQIAKALPKGMDAARMMRIAMTSVAKNPVLKQCTPTSVGLSIIRAAESGLLVDGWEGHLVPFKNKGVWEAQFIADYKGMAKLCYQSELVIEIHAEVICLNDEFDYEKGTGSFLRWRPARSDRGAMIGAWAGAKMAGGGFPFVVMWRDEIMEHKAASPSANSSWSPWNVPSSEPWMWKKTAVRVLCKLLPRSAQLSALLRGEDDDDYGSRSPDQVQSLLQGVGSGSDAPLQIERDKESKSDQMAERLAQRKPADKPPAPKAEPAKVPEAPPAKPKAQAKPPAKPKPAAPPPPPEPDPEPEPEADPQGEPIDASFEVTDDPAPDDDNQSQVEQDEEADEPSGRMDEYYRQIMDCMRQTELSKIEKNVREDPELSEDEKANCLILSGERRVQLSGAVKR